MQTPYLYKDSPISRMVRAPAAMDPLYEQRLRDEVLYLHSLWHQGPPRPATAPSTSTFTPTPTAASDTRYHLLPSKPTHFKKKRKRTGNTWNLLPGNATPGSSSPRGAEWPCPATPPPTTAWHAAGGPTPDPPPLSPEEQSKLASKRAHQRALEAVREFFMKDGSDEMGSRDDDDTDGDCSDDEDTEGDSGEGDYTFLSKLFEDSELKEYYSKNFVAGAFSCLVCGAVGGKNSSKKFKGCLPLVQHSISIAKTKRRGPHRALAQAICNVVGWNIDRLPEIVSMLSDKSGSNQGNDAGANEDKSVAFVDNLGYAKDDASNGKDDEVEPASDVGKNIEGLAPDGLTISDSACHDAVQTENQGRPRGSAAIVSTSEAERQRPSPSHMPSTSGWATLEKCNSKALSSPEEQSILAARHAHQNALKIIHEFFRTTKSDEIDSGCDDDDDDDGGSDSDDDDDDELMGEGSGGGKYNFFFKVFEESTELREHYVKNFAEGEFSCLVCGAVGGKGSGKKFKGCFPLVQHSINIGKTKKRKAHRAFGQAVCKTVGWDIGCLHNIASMLSEKTAEIQQRAAEPTSQGLATVTISPDHPIADEIENLDNVHHHNGEQPASEGSMINDNLHGDNSVDPIAG